MKLENLFMILPKPRCPCNQANILCYVWFLNLENVGKGKYKKVNENKVKKMKKINLKLIYKLLIYFYFPLPLLFIYVQDVLMDSC